MTPRAAVIGSGPNGLAAAIRMAQAGFAVEVFEGSERVGGGASCAELTLPGFVHDLGSAIHPMAISSPFFRSLPLEHFGLRWLQPDVPMAHPFDDGSAVCLLRDLHLTGESLGPDEAAYLSLVSELVRHWPALMSEVLKPLPAIPRKPLLMGRFGLRALQPARALALSLFSGPRARALFAGSAAHSFLPLDNWMSASFGIILSASAHAVGWPIPESGSQSISNALVRVLELHGGAVRTGTWIRSLSDLGDRDVVLCDITPKQFLQIAGTPLTPGFRAAMERYCYGPGVFKVDWALREPIPWKAAECRRAGTVHVCGTLEEVAASEAAMLTASPSEKPFVIVTQPSLYDRSRAPKDQHTAWGYAHVPHGWIGSYTEAIESQIERFAPGFRECVLARAVTNPVDLERWNPNLIGGDINGGLADLKQFMLRPTIRHYRTSLPNVYLCSSSTPPGGGVHGMCGFRAAETALRRWRVASRR